jgi:hypothetical protein
VGGGVAGVGVVRELSGCQGGVAVLGGGEGTEWVGEWQEWGGEGTGCMGEEWQDWGGEGSEWVCEGRCGRRLRKLYNQNIHNLYTVSRLIISRKLVCMCVFVCHVWYE